MNSRSVIFLGKGSSNGFCKGVQALKILIEKKFNVTQVVSCDEHLKRCARNNNIPVHSVSQIQDFYQKIKTGEVQEVDYVISYGFSKLVKPILLNLAKQKCLNFHPAPLPEWAGMGGVFNYALYEGVSEWGVTAHEMDEIFDNGPLIRRRKFDIDSSKETVKSLIEKSHNELLGLFKEVVDDIYNGNELQKINSSSQDRRYISRKKFEALRKVSLSDSSAVIDRKIKSFFYPPFHGASIVIDGKEYTLINEEILQRLRGC